MRSVFAPIGSLSTTASAMGLARLFRATQIYFIEQIDGLLGFKT